MSNELISSNKFLQVLLAARRAKQLINGDRKRIEIKSENPLTVALEEIHQKKIDFTDILHMPLIFEKPPEEEAPIAETAEDVPLSELLSGTIEEGESETEEEVEAEVEVEAKEE